MKEERILSQKEVDELARKNRSMNRKVFGGAAALGATGVASGLIFKKPKLVIGSGALGTWGIFSGAGSEAGYTRLLQDANSSSNRGKYFGRDGLTHKWKTKEEWEKRAVFAFTPWDVTSKKELESGKGWLKEFGNRFVSSIPSAFVGGAVGMAARKPILAYTGALATGAISDIRTIRKTEREAGVVQSGPKKIFGRYVGRSIGNLGFGTPGAEVADWAISRKLQTYKEAKKNEIF